MEVFRFRLNCIDHYQATPTDLDPILRRGSGPSQRQNAPPVPVIRVFGAAETGQKVCAHIHGALPYLYVEYDGSLDGDAVDSYILALRASIDHALAATYRRNTYDGKSVYVGHITLVKGVPFYGYNVGYKLFLKIYMLNPLHMTRFADLLYQGAILNRVFQPYESHLQYLLQWMCDYNLYGCAYIDCAKVQFRSPVPDSDEIDTRVHKWHDASIPEELVADSDQYPRQSHCTLEIDLCVQDILNRHKVHARPIHHNFLERLAQMNPEDKFVPSMAGLWRDETRRRRLRMGITDPFSSPFPPEGLVSMSADPRDTNKGGWIHEEEYRELVEELVREERGKNPAVHFDTFVKPIDGKDQIRTAVESVEDLYPWNLQVHTLGEEQLDVEIGSVNDAITRNFAENAVAEFETLGDNGVLGEVSNGDEANHESHTDSSDQPAMDPLSASEALAENFADNIHADERININEPDEQSGSSATSSPRKRRYDVLDMGSSKKQRILTVPTQENMRQVYFQNEKSNEDKESNKEGMEDEPPRSSQFSQASIKAHGRSGPTTLSFPVVKNPNAPETALRLSQSGYSNSQDTSESPAVKDTDAASSNASPITPLSHQKITPTRPSVGSPRANEEAISLVTQLENSFTHSPKTIYYRTLPPSSELVATTMLNMGLPPVIYQDAYYSNELDVPERPREYAGREFKLQSTTLPYLPPFDPTGTSPANFGDNLPVVLDKAGHESSYLVRSRRCQLRHWEIATLPPSFTEVEEWIQSKQEEKPAKGLQLGPNKDPVSLPKQLSQIEGPTQRNKHGFKYSQKQEASSVKHEAQYMSILSVEVHINSRGQLVPDPVEDEIQCIFWRIQGEENADVDRPTAGLLCLSDENGIAQRMTKQISIEVEMVDIVRQFDPDILTGFERARLKMKSQSHGRFGKDADRWGFTHTSTIRVTGRHMINIWRAMRGELNLLQYTMENVAFHLLHKRIPHYSHADLTTWYKSEKPRDLAKLNLDILEANEIVPRTSEQARLLGVDFFSVFSRGSQFKVESTMFRIAKPENFVLQNALECLPLVMEPQSAFYNSPLLVLDFQSLYPSVMIAYNYCYSTCLGRIVSWRGRNKMGFMDFKREPQLLELVKDYINIAPNGMMYVKPEMRKSLLAKMLGEILETRVMVKSGMKMDKNDKTLQQLLNNRQLALKLLANVTYGYTSASFSGRMPCSEIADSIVQTGRETLEKAIALIHSVQKWGAEVVYGDTDSLFVYLKGRTRDQAFMIGEEIAEAVTKANPRPIRLKFEKVYHPCVLLAKKRYVGFKYEHRSQTEPDFDAKGIETVRRDGTPAEQKIEEKALKILFRTSDLSEVKRYFQSQYFLFAKEVKLGTYSDRGPPPPGALIATKRMLVDPRSEPQYGERVPYVVITGAPGARLIDRCVSPDILLQNGYIELDAEYYISKNLIPPLERIFNLVGANVRQWYDEMPKVQRIRNITLPFSKADSGKGNTLVAGGGASLTKTLESYMKSSACLVCRSKLSPPPTIGPGVEVDIFAMLPVCSECLVKPARALLMLKEKVRKSERRVKQVDMVCRNCSNLAWGDEVRCDSRDCPVFYTRIRERANLAGLREGVGGVVEFLEGKGMESNGGRLNEVEKDDEDDRVPSEGLGW
ncbi:hypothetical protein CC78DRAFT_557135 [Lojkania enalia]|uniref:DNA polymerase n=1 Tax=Lojkania enalia TaxID=147567 RepID=A0A9P4NDL0_9PLEO|nr:hypothetical protein CC78DRAFT_557135 [Didymosphaeria enalia]